MYVVWILYHVVLYYHCLGHGIIQNGCRLIFNIPFTGKSRLIMDCLTTQPAMREYMIVFASTNLIVTQKVVLANLELQNGKEYCVLLLNSCIYVIFSSLPS